MSSFQPDPIRTAPTPAPLTPRYQRLRGRLRWAHQCRTPGALTRWIRRIRVADVWQCACGQRWRWGVHPMSVRLGFRRNLEWVRCA